MTDGEKMEESTKKKAVSILLTASMLNSSVIETLSTDIDEQTPKDPYHHPSSKPTINTPENPEGRHIPRKVRRKKEKERLSRR